MSKTQIKSKLPISQVLVNKPLAIVYAVLIICSIALCLLHDIVDHTQFQAHAWMSVWLIASLAFNFMRLNRKQRHTISICYIASLYALLVASRISVLLAYDDLIVLISFALFTKIIILFDVAHKDIHNQETDDQRALTKLDWHVLLVRLLIALVFIPHCTEKLFSGPLFRNIIVQAFVTMDITNPFMFVITAGLCEFFASFALSMGFLTRLTAICISIFMLTATYLGDHFNIGFNWAAHGGGWEYPILWTCLLLCFAIFGPGYFSVDQALIKRYQLPKWIRRLMGV